MDSLFHKIGKKMSRLFFGEPDDTPVAHLYGLSGPSEDASKRREEKVQATIRAMGSHYRLAEPKGRLDGLDAKYKTTKKSTKRSSKVVVIR